MKSSFNFTYDDTDFYNKVKYLKKNAPKIFKDAAEEAGLKFMEWATFGSPREPVKSPIKSGDLRYDSVYLKTGNRKKTLRG